MTLNRRFGLVELCIVIGAASPVSAIVTSDEYGSHRVGVTQSAWGIDLSGIAVVGSYPPSGEIIPQCSGVLISERHVLSAAHCFDEDADGFIDPWLTHTPQHVIFETDAGWHAISYDPSMVRWPNIRTNELGDLAVVTLAAEAPEYLPRYPLYGGSDEIGQPVVLAGYGNPGHGSIGETPDGDVILTKRAGLNRYEALRGDYLVYDFDSGQDVHNALAITGFESDRGFGEHEVNPARGDSGGSGFINGAVAGIIAHGMRLPAADATDQLDRSWGEGSFDTRVSAFREFILEATDGSSSFVPEPSQKPEMLFTFWACLTGHLRSRRTGSFRCPLGRRIRPDRAWRRGI